MSDGRQVEAKINSSMQPAKRRWVSPTVDELDFRAAANGPGAPRPTDFTTYSS